MFFAFSKIFWMLVQPLNAICLLILAGGAIWWLFSLRIGKSLVLSGCVLLLVLGVFPTGPLLLTWLERHYPPIEIPQNLDGIVVLGGAFNAHATQRTGQLSANEDIGRMFCALDVMQSNPKAKVVFTGGSGDLLNQSAKEGAAVRHFMAYQKPFGNELIYEEQSRNTYENAIFSKSLIEPKPEERWLLVTSAYHMPRSASIFAQAQWNVIAYPCARRTSGSYSAPFKRLPSVTDNFASLNIALKEVIGNAAYVLTGKSASFLPRAKVPSPHAKNNQDSLPSRYDCSGTGERC